ncbi:MAG: hypothetical protein R3A11_02325 [Bdellovibrionota bacterium]
MDGYYVSAQERQQCYSQCATGDCPESCYPAIFEYVYGSFGGPSVFNAFPGEIQLAFGTPTGAVPSQMPGHTVAFPLAQFSQTPWAQNYMNGWNQQFMTGGNPYSAYNPCGLGSNPGGVYGNIYMNPCSAGQINVMPGFATPMPSVGYFAIGQPQMSYANFNQFGKKCVRIGKGVSTTYKRRNYEAEFDAEMDEFRDRLGGLGTYWKTSLARVGNSAAGLAETLLDNLTIRAMLPIQRANARLSYRTAMMSLYSYQLQQQMAVNAFYVASLGDGCNSGNVGFNGDGEDYYLCCGCEIYSGSDLQQSSQDGDIE